MLADRCVASRASHVARARRTFKLAEQLDVGHDRRPHRQVAVQADAVTAKPRSDDVGYLPSPSRRCSARIQWWLDDSEDFKKWEQERLNKLGFDTEKSRRRLVPRDDRRARERLPKDRTLWIEFDGVAMRSATFTQRPELGEHDGMFSRFELRPHAAPQAGEERADDVGRHGKDPADRAATSAKRSRSTSPPPKSSR